MSKTAYVGVNNVARKVKSNYIGIDGVARKLKKHTSVTLMVRQDCGGRVVV